MAAVVRVWLGFAALGAGLIHLALVVDSAPAFGVPVLVIGAAEFVWGVVVVSRSQLPLPRTARLVALLPLLGWALMLVLSAAEVTTGVRVLPLLVASAFDLAVAVGITALLRRDRAAPERPLSAGRSLIGLAIGALVVTALAVPALAATEPGGSIVPAGEFDLTDLLHGH